MTAQQRENKAASWAWSSLPANTLKVTGDRKELCGTWVEGTCICEGLIGSARFRLDSTVAERMQGAKILKSWVELIKDLFEFYEKLKPNIYGKRIRWDSLPQELVTMPGFKLQKILVRYRVFLGTQKKKPVIVKFVESDQFEVHQLWADNALAPKVLEKKRIGSEWTRLTLEYLDPKEGWRCGDDLTMNELRKVYPDVKKALEKAHALRPPMTDGCLPVHGDARPPNLCIRQEEGKPTEVRFLDFDWAGWQGLDRYLYPPSRKVSEGIPRPDGVKLGALLQQAHDIETLWRSFLQTAEPVPAGLLQPADLGVDSAGRQAKPASRPPGSTLASGSKRPSCDFGPRKKDKLPKKKRCKRISEATGVLDLSEHKKGQQQQQPALDPGNLEEDNEDKEDDRPDSGTAAVVAQSNIAVTLPKKKKKKRQQMQQEAAAANQPR